MVFLDLISKLQGRFDPKERLVIDGPSSRLHHSFTTSVLLGCCLLITTTNIFGDPIKCTHKDHPLLKDDFINNYCWIHPTFTFPIHHKSSSFAPHPGLGTPRQGSERRFHAYYQWVPLVLFLQALMFYFPHWLWKTCEGGKVFAASTTLMNPVMRKEDREDNIELVADYLYSSLHRHNPYAIKFLICEILNFITTILNIFLMNKFLGGDFMSYGSEVFSFSEMEAEDRVDPMIVLFPRVTICNFKPYGPSGTVQILDNVCVLPHNIINEKIYLFLWAWMWVLVILGSLGFIFRCLSFFLPPLRLFLLTRDTQNLDSIDVKTLSKSLCYGDYFFLSLVHKNVSDLSFSDLVRNVSRRLIDRNKPNCLEVLENGSSRTKSNRAFMGDHS